MKKIDSLSPEHVEVARMLRALANPARLRIVLQLAGQTSCVTSDFARCLPLAPSTVSEHLRVLKEAGLVVGSIESPSCYCLDRSALARLATFLQELAAPAGREASAPARERR